MCVFDREGTSKLRSRFAALANLMFEGEKNQVEGPKKENNPIKREPLW